MPTKKLPGPFYIVATASSSQVLSATTISTVGVPTQLVIYPRRKAADSLTKLTLKPRVGFTVNNGVSVSKLPSNPPANWGKVTAPSRGYKYVKGDPNYDYELNPLATKLSGPLTGLLAYLTVLGIAVLFYIMGTILRIRYLVMYRRLKKQMQPVTGIIVNGQVVSGIHVANAAIAAKLP
ncbi:hypothetical protein EV182_006020 [Spiromyces aspiralis]|uniref:Uncharacterized protein n=1 Tax=Spiromyces aspiralis TaxID=68401 RepID=A0ACC1HMG9_9FUNG|nr:hypothetical protein EV182_006020 [Spiromyces aspiralis]